MTDIEREDSRLRAIVRRLVRFNLRAIDLLKCTPKKRTAVLAVLAKLEGAGGVTDDELRTAIAPLPLCRYDCSDTDIVLISQWYRRG